MRRPARSASSTSAASASAPATGATRRRRAAAFLPDPREPERRADLPHRRPRRGSTTTGWSTSSAAPTRRSRAAATASSWARSRPRSTRVAGVRECAVVGVETGGLRGHGDLLRLLGDDAELEPPAAAARLTRVAARLHAAGALAGARRAAEEQNGKIDRQALRERFPRRDADTSPGERPDALRSTTNCGTGGRGHSSRAGSRGALTPRPTSRRRSDRLAGPGHTDRRVRGPSGSSCRSTTST